MKTVEGEVDFSRLPETVRPSTMRAMGHRPCLDEEVDRLPIAGLRGASALAVRLLRLYRRIRPETVGNRCVFEPSCSRYSELAFRQKPFLSALRLTRKRLKRCRPGAGGTDLTDLELPKCNTSSK